MGASRIGPAPEWRGWAGLLGVPGGPPRGRECTPHRGCVPEGLGLALQGGSLLRAAD